MGNMDVRKILPRQTIEVVQKHYSDVHAKTFEGMNHRTRALYFKTQTHQLLEADYIIYVDGKVQVTSHKFIEHMIDTLGDNVFAMLKHGTRQCIYEEVDYIEQKIQEGSTYLATRYGARPIRSQVDYYRQCGYPANNGLNDCSIFIRKVTVGTNLLFDKWWDVIRDGKMFDQTAIQFLAWEQKLKIVPIVFPEGYFKLVKHLKVI